MNNPWILFHLLEAQEELTRTIKELEVDPPEDDAVFRVGIEHLYHHLNTAWNSRHATDAQLQSPSDDQFGEWSDFPPDISMRP